MNLVFPAAIGRFAKDEAGSMLPGFLVTSAIAAIAALIAMFATHALATSTTLSETNNAIARAAQETCTQIHAGALHPTTNATLRTFNGSTYTFNAPQVVGTPLPVTVKIAAASNGVIPMDLSANGVMSQADCPIPSPKPAYGSTVTVP
jgi:hypothetical protein